MEWYILALLSAVFLGISPIISKKILLKEHATEFVTTTLLLVSIGLLPVIGRADFSVRWEIWVLMLCKAVLISTSLILGFKATRHLEISAVEPLKNLSVVFVTLMAFIFLSERVDILQGFGILLVLIGSYSLEVYKHHPRSLLIHNKFVTYFLLAVFLASVAIILDRVMLQYTSVWTIMIIPNFMMTIILLVYQGMVFKGFKDIGHVLNISGISILFVVILKIAADLTYLGAIAIPAAAVSLVIAIKRLGVFISTFLGGELFHDHHLLRKTLSCILMLVGVYLIIL